MKIVYLEDIGMIDPNTKQPMKAFNQETKQLEPVIWSMNQYVRWIIDTNAVFNQTGPGIRTGCRVLDAFKDKKPGDTVEIALDDYQPFKKASEEPKEYPSLQFGDKNGNIVATVSLARQLLPFIDAIANAT